MPNPKGSGRAARPSLRANTPGGRKKKKDALPTLREARKQQKATASAKLVAKNRKPATSETEETDQPEPKRQKFEDDNTMGEADDLMMSIEEQDNVPFDLSNDQFEEADDDTDEEDSGEEPTIGREAQISIMEEALQGLVDPDTSTADVNLLPQGIDFEELQHADQYNDEGDPEFDPLADIPTTTYGEDDSEDELAGPSTATMGPPTLPSQRTSTIAAASEFSLPEDNSTLILHQRVHFNEISIFNTALGMWSQEAGLSRQQFLGLREIISLMGPELKPTSRILENLPKTLSTLAKHTKGVLPLLPMRKQTIDLIPEKQPTDAEGQKKGRKPREKVTEDLVFFDLAAMFQAFLSTKETTDKMHIGMAELVDEPSELFHSHAWASSIRTTSGQYAHLTWNNMDEGPAGLNDLAEDPIFPSDFILFLCDDKQCKESHLGRVTGVYRDRRTATAPELQGSIVLEVRNMLSAKEITTLEDSDEIKALFVDISPRLKSNEVVLTSTYSYVAQGQVVCFHDKVIVDHLFQEPHGSAEPKTASREYEVLLRRTIEEGETAEGEVAWEVRPMYQQMPLRGELELEQYGREHFMASGIADFNWWQQKYDKSHFDGIGVPWDEGSRLSNISVPLLTFIDGFGVYRNTYRTLMGMYVINAALTFMERTRRSNVLPLTLGPHGSNFADVCEALEGSLAPLEKGLTIKINNQDVFVSVFTLTYIGDMPQQQVNAGCKTQRANLGCRFCFITTDERRQLEYDTVKNGRYHYQHKEMIRHMKSLDKKSAGEYGRKWGLDPDEDVPLAKISPALDLLMTRPSDPAHSEYQGLSRLFHELLLEAILTKAAGREYYAFMRTFPFPPGFARLQSPLHHLKQYSLSDHARWAIIIGPLLRCFLKKSHIRKVFMAALRTSAPTSVSDIKLIQSVISAFVSLAKSNNMLMGDSLAVEDREKLHSTVVECRSNYQALVECAANSFETDERRHDHPARRASTRATSIASYVEVMEQRETQPQPAQDTEAYTTKAGKSMIRKEALPNIHTALHASDTANEYGLPVHCNTLIGEDKHRWFKKIVYTTNHRNIERIMLTKENFRQTIRLVLFGAFANDEPQITAMIQRIRQQCPTLFETVLPRSELQSTRPDVQLDDEEDDELPIQEDEYHQRPRVIARLKASYVRSTFGLPTRASQTLPPAFRQALRKSYERDYGLPNIGEFGTSVIPYSKKISFHDPTTEHQVVFRMGDFIQWYASMEPDAPTYLGRLEHIITHTDVNKVDRVFLNVKQVFETDPPRRDAVLDVPVLETIDDGGMELVGLPMITSKKVYMLATTDEEASGGQGLRVGGTDLLFMDWAAQFL